MKCATLRVACSAAATACLPCPPTPVPCPNQPSAHHTKPCHVHHHQVPQTNIHRIHQPQRLLLINGSRHAMKKHHVTPTTCHVIYPVHHQTSMPHILPFYLFCFTTATGSRHAGTSRLFLISNPVHPSIRSVTWWQRPQEPHQRARRQRERVAGCGESRSRRAACAVIKCYLRHNARAGRKKCERRGEPAISNAAAVAARKMAARLHQEGAQKKVAAVSGSVCAQARA